MFHPRLIINRGATVKNLIRGMDFGQLSGEVQL
jgi:hypothetical protein